MEPSGEVRPSPEPALAGVRHRLPLAERTDAHELLDGDSLDIGEVEANLRDLARLNRLPGGTSASMNAVARLLDGIAEPSVLDVGTGGADAARYFARRGWRTTAVDVHPLVLQVARRNTGHTPLIEVAAADGRALPFADASFDVAHCSLLIHHFDRTDALAVLREMRRVARRGVVVNDLRRGPLAFVATILPTLAMSRSRVTRQDGVASARRAYTLAELDELLAEAGLAVAWRSSRWLPRVTTVAAPAQ